MFSVLVPIATLLPLLYYIGELPIFNNVKKDNKSIFILILTLSSLFIWVILAVHSLNFEPILLTSFFKVEIGDFKIPISFKIDRMVLFFIFANIGVFLHPIVINLLYKNSTTLKWFPLGMSAVTAVILSGNVLALLFAMTTLSFCFLIDDILQPEEILQNKGVLIFIFQRILDTVILILLVLMLNKTNFESVELGHFTLIPYRNFLEHPSGFWIILMLIFKSVIQILDVLLLSKHLSIERIFVEINAGFLVLIFVLARFVFVINLASGLKTIILFGTLPLVAYVTWILIQEENINKILVSVAVGFFLNAIMAIIIQSAGASFYLVLASLMTTMGLLVHFKYIESKSSQNNLDSSKMVLMGPWHRAYLIIFIVVMFLPPGSGIIGAVTNILWNQMHSNEMIFIGFFYTLCLQSVLIWFFARMFFLQLTSRREKNVPREGLSYKAILVLYALLMGLVVLLNLSFDLGAIGKNIFLLWYDKFYMNNHATIPVNIWFMILWSLFFLLVIMGAYIVYYAKKEDINLDKRLKQKTKPIKEFIIYAHNLLLKNIGLFILTIIKIFFKAGMSLREQSCDWIVIVSKEMNRNLGLITVFELRTPTGQLGVYLWMLLFMLLGIYIKW